MPVSQWMVDAISPQPGHRVLELAAGPGDTGFLAAQLIRPGGVLTSSDISEPMLDVARERAAELGIDNAEFTVINAEWIDLPTASQDGVLGRWVYMLLADPGAALRETRRVLRPGGRVALAAWAEPAANPWRSLISAVMYEQGLVGEADPDAPGMFAWQDSDRIRVALEGAGFTEIALDDVDSELRFDSLQDWWGATLDYSVPLSDTVAGLEERQVTALLEGLEAAGAGFRTSAGGYAFPARTHVASAEG